MPYPMPYILEKGPFFELTESYANDDAAGPDRLMTLLADLRDPNKNILDMYWMKARDPFIAAGGRHLIVDWFGYKKPEGPGQQPYQKQDPFNATSNPRTGFWKNWYGDAESVVRETAIRAIEVATGLYHGQAIPAPPGRPPRHWPISYFWCCGAPFFQGWVTWLRTGPGYREGQVTVIFVTPGVEPTPGAKMLLSTPRSPEALANNWEEYREGPVSADGMHGMWVVGHEALWIWNPVPSPSAPQKAGDWFVPPPGGSYVAQGNVITCSPAERDGGVLGGGRTYIP